MAFVNRKDELAALRSWWERPGARPALVWGRRRVGKSALLQHFAAETIAPVVFHTGTGEAPGAEIASLCRQTAVAQRGLTRVPVLVGESKWASSVNAVRIKAGLVRKAAALAPDAEGLLRYAICARENVTHADEDTLTVTAADIFGP